MAGDRRVVIGINDGHNAAAALLVDGRFVAAVQEERLSRVKNQGGMPHRAIETVLGQAGLTRGSVDAWAVATAYQDRYVSWDPQSVRARYAERDPLIRQAAREIPGLRALRRRYLSAARRRLLKGEGIADGLHLVEHHAAHAAAALWACPDPGPWLVLTADGFGDDLCATVGIGSGSRVQRIASTPARHSIGQLYSYVTYLLGMVPLEHEYKVMGLAPYGLTAGHDVERLKRDLLDMFVPVEGGLSWRTRISMLGAADAIAALLGRERFDLIAAAVQSCLEDHLVAWVRAAVKATGIHRVAISGGVFMNVKANQRVARLEEVTELVVTPSCGDETNAFGAAYHVASQGGDAGALQPLADLYLGPAPTSEEAEAALANAPDLAWRRSSQITRDVAQLLAQGEVVARCAGRMEFGARALGDRSILADPSRREIVDVLNRAIKSRDFWMPFAPSILVEDMPKYTGQPSVPSPFMMLTFDVLPAALNEIIAAVHPADRTARVQVIDERADPEYRELLREFKIQTGRGALLNTSFNLHGEPIVCSAEDAIDVFRRSALRYMQIADVIVQKRHS